MCFTGIKAKQNQSFITYQSLLLSSRAVFMMPNMMSICILITFVYFLTTQHGFPKIWNEILIYLGFFTESQFN